LTPAVAGGRSENGGTPYPRNIDNSIGREREKKEESEELRRRKEIVKKR
jgi:hypothetical protein